MCGAKGESKSAGFELCVLMLLGLDIMSSAIIAAMAD
jgi:hypothetical protein